MAEQISKYELLRAKLDFDPLRLDEQLTELPTLIVEVADETAFALRDHAQKCSALKVVEARAEHAVRASYAGQKAPTESAIKAEVLLRDDVQAAIAVVEDAKLSLALWQGLMDGFRTKTSAMKRYAELTISGYLSPQSVYEARRSELAKRRQTLVKPA